MEHNVTLGPGIDEANGGLTAGDRTYGTFLHAIGIASLVDAAFISFFGTLIMWLIKRNEDPFLDDHGREAMNFQITLVVYWLMFGAFVLVTFGVGILMLPVMYLLIAVLRVVGCVRGAIAANQGRYYRYPMCFRFIAPRA